MQIVVVPVLHDNYSYLLIDEQTKMCAAIDPVEPTKVLQAAQDHDVSISIVLTTHSHADHDGGNTEMKRLLPEVVVVGGRNDNVRGVTREVDDQEIVRVGALQVRVLSTPCHTPGHVLYLCEDALFTGDTLFIAGCGRFNSGTPEQMHYALNTVIAKLPRSTKVYCGHEYATNNLRFAVAVEPENWAIHAKLEWSQTVPSTIPSTISSELDTNPFMRVDVRAVQKYAGSADPITVMAILRERKNSFGLGAGVTK
ncbi:hydroxyacylglutathione hydrolase [Aphanomyces invadans]|uniref:hydroxyacylglutathione hydrolase n=1 Tax=Aphanomyces invadans TaxID=157072 RepID=A0A024UC58_9STRA|nr:hydroxyacylglutathione hydrolase [Aphanomyces invadans]ETW03986.1 hydroxyacylglutathione hydrolase [Aphanomyces invadans]|eukprot:XP_008866942.1 hydroxyacylglutathione hydrolase [Aphanomyces invadans]